MRPLPTLWSREWLGGRFTGAIAASLAGASGSAAFPTTVRDPPPQPILVGPDPRGKIEAGRERWRAICPPHLYDLETHLQRLAGPVPMLAGERLHVVGHKDEMLRQVSDARLATNPAGRFCMSWQRAEAVGAAAVAFIGEG